MQIHNAIITGSFSYNGADLSNVTSSNAYSASLSSRTTNLESTSSVLVGASSSFSSILTSVSSSQQQLSSSFLTLTASFNAVSASQQQISASYIALSASYNTFSGSASTRITVDSASLLQVSASQQQISASLLNVISIFATTGSNSFRETQSITGSLTVTGQIIAQTLNVQQVTSSIIYSSGSNNFGCDLNSRQTFTGSVLITGSLTIAGASSATSYSGTTIYGSTAVCSPVGLFSGCVGIGITGPSANLDINATGGLGGWTGIRLKTGTSSVQSLSMGQVVAGNGAWIGMAQYNQGGYWQTEGTAAAVLNFESDGTFRISTNSGLTANTNYNITERLRITSAGNVGINTTTPNSVLHIEASNNTTNQFRVNSCDGLNAGVRSYTTCDCAGLIINHYYAVSGNPYLRTSDFVSNQGDAAATQMRFFTKAPSANAALAMIITCGGDVGIGNSLPSYKLDVCGTARFTNGSTAQNVIISSTNAGSTATTLQISNSSNSAFNDGVKMIQGGGTLRFHDLSDNPLLGFDLSNTRVGVLTTAPLTPLDVKQSSTGTATANAAFRDSSTNGNALQIWNGNNEARFRAVYYGTASDQSITFHTITSAGSEGERMKIRYDGNVGIGTNSPGDIIDVQRNQNAVTNFYFRNTNTTNTNSRAYLNLISGNTTLLLAAINNDNTYLKPTNATNLYLGYDNALKITSGGNLEYTFTPNAYYHVSTESGKISVASGGTLDFGTFSGMIIVNNHTNGQIGIWLVGAGSTALVSTLGSTSGLGTMAYNGGINGYTWTSNQASTAFYGFYVVKTRANA